MGQIAEKYWYEISEHFPFVKLKAFVVMPFYIYGIIMIDYTDDGMAKKSSDSKKNETNISNTSSNAVPTPISGVSVCGIIKQFKRNVMNKSRKIHANFGWKFRFHDHIIRDAESFERIRSYKSIILKNGLKINFICSKFHISFYTLCFLKAFLLSVLTNIYQIFKKKSTFQKMSI